MSESESYFERSVNSNGGAESWRPRSSSNHHIVVLEGASGGYHGDSVSRNYLSHLVVV